ILVFSASGQQLADLKVASPKPEVRGRLYLANRRGDLRLERLRISRWNGEPPREAQAQKSRIDLVDGSIAYGQITGFDADREQFLVRGEQAESRWSVAKPPGIYLSAPGDVGSRTLKAVSHDGSRLSGELTAVEKGEVRLGVPGISEPVRLPLDSLRSLVV